MAYQAMFTGKLPVPPYRKPVNQIRLTFDDSLDGTCVKLDAQITATYLERAGRFPLAEIHVLNLFHRKPGWPQIM